LPFSPINARNAVLEGVVTLALDRAITNPEANAIRACHDRLSLDLPRLDEIQVVSLFFGPDPPPAMPTPFAMEAFQRDGALESRLFVNGQLLVANFLVYSRWREHWEKALLWFRTAKDALLSVQNQETGESPLRVIAVGHQMIDVFRWDGDPAAVSASVMFKPGPDRLPEAALRSVGQPWSASHSYLLPASPHEGAGSSSIDLFDALTCELGEEPSVGWRVRLDHLQESRLRGPVRLADILDGDVPRMEILVNNMHARNKEVVSSLVADDMLTRVRMRSA